MLPQLILYSKVGCCLCENLAHKLDQVNQLSLTPRFELLVRDIGASDRWTAKYEYEVPVLCFFQQGEEIVLPRVSPRCAIAELDRLLQVWFTQIPSADP
ncbi:MAG: glutaredoxin family protein [Pseudanabaenaceae cyanobacterium bins.68]|nr:glutaredoxin family protein [Pseudanabaenaceae cyanobacterium bins.68]